jgi:hypothetical protein
MSKESERHELDLLDGWREFVISDCREETSKAGNDMFIFTIIDKETEQIGDLYAIATQGKRWFLKSLLIAVGLGGKDGKFKWDIPDVINKVIMGKVINVEDTYINKEGETVTKSKSKVIQVKVAEKKKK